MYMKALRHPARWRPFALLAALAAVAVAIPVASGASAPAKVQPSALHQSKLVIAHSVQKKNGAKPKPGHGSTCAGGSIAPGTYSSLTITGFCTVDQGAVIVQHDVTVAPNAGLIAAFGGGPKLVVGGNLKVKTNGVLVLGCEPEAFICFNDPDQEVGTLSSPGTIFGNLDAHNALAVLVHATTVGRNLQLVGGGGGVNCDSQEALGGAPAYATFEDLSVGGNATISHWQSCWLGLFRTTVRGNVSFHDNVNADPDGNEIQTNIVNGNLDCHGDSPAAQQGDSGGNPNIVLGHATGECAALVGP
jgi:hypothetical protein